MTILDEIVLYKKELLSSHYYHEKLKTINKDTQCNQPSKKNTLKSSLVNDKELSIIAEIKSKNPTVKQLPERNLTQQIKDYETYGANAISILTDERYFGGSFERLQQLSKQTSLPVLCKDFVIDEIQIDVAKAAVASIILLIVNILTDEQLHRLYHYACQLDLEVLVEVHDSQELQRAYELKPEIIGVNNRDLKRFVTDVAHTNQILAHKKDDFYYISESGIHNQSDVEKIVHSGIDGLLIGEALMKCDDLSQFLPQLKLKKVKSCI